MLVHGLLYDSWYQRGGDGTTGVHQLHGQYMGLLHRNLVTWQSHSKFQEKIHSHWMFTLRSHWVLIMASSYLLFLPTLAGCFSSLLSLPIPSSSSTSKRDENSNFINTAWFSVMRPSAEVALLFEKSNFKLVVNYII